jgi:CBS domain containing-hemolysin-like protein
MELLIILPLIPLNGLFPMSEMALVSARKARLEVASNDFDGRTANRQIAGQKRRGGSV